MQRAARLLAIILVFAATIAAVANKRLLTEKDIVQFCLDRRPADLA